MFETADTRAMDGTRIAEGWERAVNQYTEQAERLRAQMKQSMQRPDVV
jgi:hypothetical protein